MLTVTKNLAEKIISNKIDRQEAIRSFESLSETDKKKLISKLKGKLSENNDKIEKNFPIKNRYYTLKAVHERNLNDQQKKFINKLAKYFEKFAPKSKKNATKYQYCFVDQRKTAGFKKPLKALQFHLTYDKGEGPYLYDIDGNKYVDITGDNGVNIFGHQPEFIKNAIGSRLNKGYPLVGYTEELFEAAKLLCELTGHERVLFTQSGTEAVMWACRIARAATQKKKIVIFEGSFHGLSDTVLAGKDKFGNSMAMGPGLLQEFADQLVVLEYGDMGQLDIIEDKSKVIAGVLVEPVQSRFPHKQPVEFLKELRKLTLEKDIPLIFDEMITGFRVCSEGVQGYFNIKADIATYGKIPGGGMPTGIVAGLAKYMNYIDGGAFSFYDESMPSLKKTLMGGTHTRNSIKIAATLASLSEIKKICSKESYCSSCSCLLAQLNERTESMVKELNAFFIDKEVPVVIDYFSSLFRFRFLDDPYGLVSELFFILLRMNGVETSVSGNNFLTLSHTDENLKFIIGAVKESINTLLGENFFYKAEFNEIEHPEENIQEFVKLPRVNSRIQAVEKINNNQIEKLKKLIKNDLEKFQGSDQL